MLQLEEERQKQKENRKKEREKLVNKRRGLDSLVKDAESRAKTFENQVMHCVLYHSCVAFKQIKASYFFPFTEGYVLGYKLDISSVVFYCHVYFVLLCD